MQVLLSKSNSSGNSSRGDRFSSTDECARTAHLATCTFEQGVRGHAHARKGGSLCDEGGGATRSPRGRWAPSLRQHTMTPAMPVVGDNLCMPLTWAACAISASFCSARASSTHRLWLTSSWPWRDAKFVKLPVLLVLTLLVLVFPVLPLARSQLSPTVSHHRADGLYMALRNRAICLSNIANLSRSIFKSLARRSTSAMSQGSRDR